MLIMALPREFAVRWRT